MIKNSKQLKKQNKKKTKTKKKPFFWNSEN